jgi:hypothetical protein
MRDTGYSTIIDAILFLAMVSLCALILNAGMAGEERQRAIADAGLRATASATLASMEASKADYFEYNTLGDRISSIAEKCGIDPGTWLYRESARAVLGRGSRHKPVMEIAVEDVACQFTLRYEGQTLKLNPLTGEYDIKTKELVNGFLRERLDRRYGFNFTLRWVPFSGVPMEGAVSCGKSVPEGAAAFSAYVTTPYRTKVGVGSIESAIAPDLTAMEKATREYKQDGSVIKLRENIRESLDGCLNNTSHLIVKEFLDDTLYRVIPAGDVGNPLALLATFSDNDTLRADPLGVSESFNVDDTLCRLIILKSSDSLDRLTGNIADGVCEGTMDIKEEQDCVLRWMSSLYEPSRARATLSVWVTADA